MPSRLIATEGECREMIHCHVWGVFGPEGVVLVDCGCGPSADALLRRAAPARIAAVLLTHPHIDHAGAAADFASRGVPVYGSNLTAHALARERRQAWYEHPELVPRCESIQPIGDGDALQLAGLEFRVLATAGHTGGCLSYRVTVGGQHHLFTGDLVGRTGHPGWAGSVDFSAEATLASLRRLRDSPLDAIFAGHWHSAENPRAVLDQAIALGEAGQWTLRKSFNTYSEAALASFAACRM